MHKARRNKMDIYKKLFTEAAYKQDAYEQKIISPRMLNFIRHMVKLKLCDPDYGNIIHPKLTSFCKQYKTGWIKESGQLCGIIFRKMKETKINSPGTKEKAYLSMLENMTAEIDNPDAAKQAVKDSLLSFKHREKAIRNFVAHQIFNQVADEEWFKTIIRFLYVLKPMRNECMDENEAREKAEEFIHSFVESFEK